MLNAPGLYNKTEYEKFNYPGRRYSLDEQCAQIYGKGYVYCGVSEIRLHGNIQSVVHVVSSFSLSISFFPTLHIQHLKKTWLSWSLKIGLKEKKS